MLLLRQMILVVCLSLLGGVSVAAPLQRQDLPAVLRDWLPWAFHGHEQDLCPLPYNSETDRVCVWPSHLSIDATATGGRFRFEVRVMGAASAVTLPGQAGLWPQDVRINGVPRPVASQDGVPVARLEPGSHVIEGQWPWSAMPTELSLPKGIATLQVQVDGVAVSRQPDNAGRIWLKQAIAATNSNDEVMVHTSRLLDDDVPMVVTTQYDLRVSGKPRDIELPAALWQGWVAESIDSPLPVRLLTDGKMVVQVRAGQWSISLRARTMSPKTALTLPSNAISSQEYWAFQAHNDVRLVTLQGVMAVDPKQVPVPPAWQHLPTYRVQPGDMLTLVESRRGNPTPNPDALQLRRDLWLDFDGRGWSVKDAIEGQLSRSSRLNVSSPYTLGRVAIDGQDQPITHMMAVTNSKGSPKPGHGFEVRQGQAHIVAESRISAELRHMPTLGWQADFQHMSATLHLPPGWRLMHAWGVDLAQGSWLAQWTLWDFFFVLLSTLAACRLVGWLPGMLLGFALALTWHMSDAPQFVWLAYLGVSALAHVLPAGRLHLMATWAQRLVVAITGLMLLPYAAAQIRLSIYPALERPWQTQGVVAQANEAQVGAAAAAPAPAPAAESQELSPTVDKLSKSSDAAMRSMPNSVSTNVSANTYNSQAMSAYGTDPSTRVQTGPGLPGWSWQDHALTWMGPVQAGQTMQLLLLPPWATALFRLLGLSFLLAAWWWVMRPLDQWPAQKGKYHTSQGPLTEPDSRLPDTVPTTIFDVNGHVLWGCVLVGLLYLVPGHVSAQKPSPVPAVNGVAAAPVPAGQMPDVALLDDMRAKLTEPPACLPVCADVPRMQISAAGPRIQLLLDVHALADVSLPLPGQGTHWQPKSVSVNGTIASARRDDAGVLWIMLPAGVHRVAIDADVGDASSVDITLPMPVHRVQSASTDWQISGIDPDGQANAAISLARRVAVASNTASGTQSEALSPFVRIERTVHLGMRWQVETHIQRVAPSLAPVQVRVQLLEGESVNDPNVQVQQGVATLSMGSESEAQFVSTLKPMPRFDLISLQVPSQIEVWRLDASPQWHVKHTGIAPVVLQTEGRWLPTWQPWPGEKVTIDAIQPIGSDGQIFTVDRSSTEVSPGLRATDVVMRVSLRASQGGNHRVVLPLNVNLLSVAIDGQVLPIQPQGAELMVPVTPGAHELVIQWREAKGMGAWFTNRAVNLGAVGVNDMLQVNVPPNRVVLAVWGPLVGPAVLFWGAFIVIVLLAAALGRWKQSPMGAFSWGLLGVGIGQMSLWGMAFVVAWFFAMEGRKRMIRPLGRRWEMARQLGLALFSLAVAAVLLETVRVGLLGYPNLLVMGNGSDASHLNWYADRFNQLTATASVVSVPVYAYRVAMLLWALWLATSVLRWLKWAWACFSEGGHWPKPAGDVTDVTAKVRS